MPPRTVSAASVRDRFKKPVEDARPPDLRDPKPVREKEPVCVRLTLPVPPTVNMLYATVKGGRRVKSARGKRYAVEVAGIASQCLAEPLTGEVAVRIEVYRPARRGDLDNYSKALLDSLKGICWVDDEQIVLIESERFEDKTNPRVELEVRAIAATMRQRNET